MTNKGNLSGRGVALLMSLSIILLLSIALMKTFESRSVEVAHLENSLQRFQAETLSRSIYRAILIAIKTKGLVSIVQNKKSWFGIPFPLQETQYFQLNEIRPIDHCFNLNWKF
ncbi:hypothetical protein KKA14_06455, partial [bacterium]|nr:hypothetical protein [bacterium]